MKRVWNSASYEPAWPPGRAGRRMRFGCLTAQDRRDMRLVPTPSDTATRLAENPERASSSMHDRGNLPLSRTGTRSTDPEV